MSQIARDRGIDLKMSLEGFSHNQIIVSIYIIEIDLKKLSLNHLLNSIPSSFGKMQWKNTVVVIG